MAYISNLESISDRISLGIEEKSMLRAITQANDCSKSAHMDETAIRKKYPKNWKIKGIRNSKRLFKKLKAKGLIRIVKTRPIEWGLTSLGHRIAMELDFC
ncbi:MAG: hypothetical protein HeimC3_39250 [Candidatus Heimdallarchaeota archaeon LC_3]|nr:MAG: hypothetical protein HeimC3_39250 [Candidatus Heimdallarchaeota archaeon LC_3]